MNDTRPHLTKTLFQNLSKVFEVNLETWFCLLRPRTFLSISFLQKGFFLHYIRENSQPTVYFMCLFLILPVSQRGQKAAEKI